MNDSDNIKYFAQELKENTYNLTRMNLVMRGIKPDNIVTRNGDTLEEDWPFFEENDPVRTYDPLYVDAVVSNPPYSLSWDPTNKESDPRYARYGLAPKSKADYAFLLHDLFHLKPDGIMNIVLPHGVLFRGGEEGEIRKNLIENNNIDAIIGLPANIFFGTGIPTIIMVLKQKRSNTDVLIIDASKGFIKEGKNNKLRASDIRKIADTVISRKDIDKFSRVVSREEIRSNEYNLNIPRYVDSSEKSETWDIYASMFGGIPKSEIDEMNEYWKVFPGLKKALFTETNSPYVEMASKDIKAAIKENSDVIQFEQSFESAFNDFNTYLYNELIDSAGELSIPQEETKLSTNIFARLKDMPLIDKYEAYQILDNEWNKIAIDLEIIQTEGWEATKKVDPNMVSKKKAGKDQEVQIGWIGHVIPFELVQTILLKNDYDALKAMEDRLSEIPSDYEEIIDSLTEDEKSSSVLNDANDSFVTKEVPKKLKELRSDEKTEENINFIDKLKKVEALLTEERKLKAAVKKDEASLQSATKVTIENLTDEQVRMLLDEKWITSLVSRLRNLPESIINNLVTKIDFLQKKYETTYDDVEKEIKETSQELASMIDELTGSEYDMKGLSEFKSLLMGE